MPMAPINVLNMLLTARNGLYSNDPNTLSAAIGLIKKLSSMTTDVPPKTMIAVLKAADLTETAPLKAVESMDFAIALFKAATGCGA